MKKLNKLFSIMLAVLMVLTVLPASATAEGDDVVNDAITVYLTLSDDGSFVVGNDAEETVMARVPITLSYFDLAEYGLEKYNRCEADSFENGGQYINDTVVEQPTLLHLMIKALEEYYLGGNKLEVGGDALSVTGDATSMYFENFWGHDSNFMFLVNHRVAFMTDNWSATADYVLLEDGMEIDIGMFSNYNFYYYGGFAYFDQTVYNVQVGEEATFQTMRSNTDMFGDDFGGDPTTLTGLDTVIYDDKWNQIDDVTDSVSQTGEFSYTFTEPGLYYVAGMDPFAGDEEDSSTAPAIAIVNVYDVPYIPSCLEGSVYYQQKADDPTQFRFIAEVSAEDVKNANSGMIVISIDGEEQYVSIKGAYKSLKANGKTINAGEGKCYIISPKVVVPDDAGEITVEFVLDNYDIGLSRTVTLLA